MKTKTTRKNYYPISKTRKQDKLTEVSRKNSKKAKMTSEK